VTRAFAISPRTARLVERAQAIGLGPRSGERVRLVADVCLAHVAYDPLALIGVDVVYAAGDREPDRVWFAAALRERPHVVLSPDSGIGRRCVVHAVRWLRTPAKWCKGVAQVPYLAAILCVWGWLSAEDVAEKLEAVPMPPSTRGRHP
jgi:hypothetical protein